MNATKIIRYGAWAAVAALVAGIGAITFSDYRDKLAGTSAELLSPVNSVGGPFTMVNGAGEPVDETMFIGKPTVLFFGFTSCPDVCPTTLAEVQSWIDKLGADANKLNYAFVTVDPERDTPEIMSSYVAAFDDRIKALTGSPTQVADMLKTYRVYARRVEQDDGGYTMDHTAGVYLMNKDNRFVGTIAYGENPDVAMEKLKRLISSAES
ncbi:SCO family protein [Breoghania sp. L-A4]|uniref:SCO family protein n=1 Tax=Breoghania sp. L-A4 TaxID=2304600 RepID=UPI000E360182|nr:SCO family protein [Breoghania sp. L-A4]AXS39586.1 SCO family protein [Breoghania sp. L-A4]